MTDPVGAALLDWACRSTEAEALPALVLAAAALIRAHGGVGTLLLCQLRDDTIGQQHDQ